MSWGTVGQWRTLSGNRVAPVITLTPDTVFIGIDDAIPLPAVVAIDDTDGDVSYKVNGPTGTIDNTVGGVGIYQYTVSDIEGNTATADYTVYIGPQEPVAVAGENISVAGGQQFTLDFTGSYDVDGDIVDYAVTQLAGESVALDFTDPIRPVGVAPISLTAQTLTFLLTVTDDSGLTATDEINIDIEAISSPAANVGDNVSAEPGVKVILSGANSSADGAIEMYYWEQVDGVNAALTIINDSDVSFVTPVSDQQLILTFKLTVTDIYGFSNSAIKTVTVSPEIIDLPEKLFVAPIDFAKEAKSWAVNHDIADVEFYPVSLSSWLLGDSIDTFTFEIEPAAVASVIKYAKRDDVIAAMIRGGRNGNLDVSVTVTTNSGRTRNRRFKLASGNF